jgi:hypothetical protein
MEKAMNAKIHPSPLFSSGTDVANCSNHQTARRGMMSVGPASSGFLGAVKKVDTMTAAPTYSYVGSKLFYDEDNCYCCLELIRISIAVLLKVFQKMN